MRLHESFGLVVAVARAREGLNKSRHARSSQKRDDLTARIARRVPVGTRKRLGGQRARRRIRPDVPAGPALLARKRHRVCSGPNPFGGVVLRAKHGRSAVPAHKAHRERIRLADA
jgi:hypothetical protein